MAARRTTITLDDHLLREIEKRAVERGITIGALIDTAIRRDLEARARKRKPFKLIVVKGNALMDMSPRSLAELSEEEDIEALRR